MLINGDLTVVNVEDFLWTVDFYDAESRCYYAYGDTHINDAGCESVAGSLSANYYYNLNGIDYYYHAITIEVQGTITLQNLFHHAFYYAALQTTSGQPIFGVVSDQEKFHPGTGSAYMCSVQPSYDGYNESCGNNTGTFYSASNDFWNLAYTSYMSGFLNGNKSLNSVYVHAREFVVQGTEDP